MRRVVVTGMGVVSSIGANANEVTASLREARSGIVSAPDYTELGFRSQVKAAPNIDWESMVDRRAARFLAPGAAYGHVAMEQAILDAGLEESEVSHDRTGLIVGAAAGGVQLELEAAWRRRASLHPSRCGSLAERTAACSASSREL